MRKHPTARRLARGSRPPASEREWLTCAMRAGYPKLATALGDALFDTMLGAFLDEQPASVREGGKKLPDFLAGSAQYPVWYAEMAALDRAHVDVLYAPPSQPMTRKDLKLDAELKLIAAHALVSLTTATDELWVALDTGHPPWRPSPLDWPRLVLVWRAGDQKTRERTISADEAAALRAAARGTSIVELTAGFGGANPHARVLDIVLGWVDMGVIAR